MRIGNLDEQSGTQNEASRTQTESSHVMYGDQAIQES